VRAIRFETEDGVLLEGELRHPDGDPVGTAVICHPDPKDGGSKDHPLLWAIRNELAGRRGFTVLAFNFRGVMGSGGAHTVGRDETLDVGAAVTRVRQEAGGPTVVAGWSFGANVALRRALDDDRIAALALVGIPLGDWPDRVPPLPASFDGLRIPVLLVAGDDDPICPESELLRLAGRLEDVEIRTFPRGGHSFPGEERGPATAIGGFFARVAQASRRGG
jgi:uncharacterized protein